MKIILYTDYVTSTKKIVMNGYSYSEPTEKKTSNTPPKYHVTTSGYREIQPNQEYTFTNPLEFFTMVSKGTNPNIILNALIELLDAFNDESVTMVSNNPFVYDLLDFIFTNGASDNIAKFSSFDSTLLAELLERDTSNYSIHQDFLHTDHPAVLLNGKLGRMEVSKGVMSIKRHTGNKYWKPTKQQHPLIHARQIYYDPYHTTFEGKYVYNMLTYKDEAEIGKKHGLPLFGLVELVKPLDNIELSRSALAETLGTTSLISTVTTHTLDSVYNQIMLRDYGKKAFFLTKGDLARSRKFKASIGKDTVAHTLYPPGLSRIAFTHNDILTRLLHQDSSKFDYITEVDITHLFFKDKKVLPDLPMGKHLIKFKHDGLVFPIFMGNDIIPRNNLKRIERMNPIVTLIIKDLGNAVDYFIRIVLEDGSRGIYGALYSNKILKRINNV